MSIHPIFAALRKHKSGVVLISLQIALTVAIVCNAAFIIAHRIELVNRPTGVNENNLVMVLNSWAGQSSRTGSKTKTGQLDSMTQQDLAALRKIPGVASVTTINAMPMRMFAVSGGAVALKPKVNRKDKSSYQRSWFYFVNQDGLPTLGLKLIAGRNFTVSEIRHSALAFGHVHDMPVAIVTRALAHELFPEGSALGKVIYLQGTSDPTRVVGIVARLMAPTGGRYQTSFTWNSVILPERLDNDIYAVRTKPGHMKSVMQAIRPTLYKVNPMRNIRSDSAVQSYAHMLAQAYKSDIGMAILMGVISLILIVVTGAGIVGLTSFWVGQRHKQIGVRRALGARKIDILRYFQIENLIIAGFGSVLGIVMAVGLNLALMQYMAMESLPIPVVLAGVVLVLVLGQAAVFVPARRASNVSPVTATRSV